MIDLDELDRLEALHREAQKDPCDRGATCTKKCWRNYPCCVRKDRDDVQFRNAAADALPELLRAARKAATMTSAEGVISSLKATLESRRREVVALTAERDAARAECERLRKLFDDAGAGEHNVLALIDHYQDEALKATSELVQARQLVALLEDRISDVEDRDDARTVCEWAATVALKSTDVHNAATRYLTGVQSPLRTRLAEVERERDADMRNVERALALADRLRSERDALAAEKALLTRRLKSYSQGTTRGEILDGTPDGTEIAYYRDGVFTRIGTPTSDDESHNCDAMGCGQNHVVQRVNVAALEATAEDARTCAEYCVKWDPVGVSSRAGYRVLGQLPPRPVAELDLDDVRVCAANVADNYSSTCPPGSNAARILAALGAK